MKKRLSLLLSLVLLSTALSGAEALRADELKRAVDHLESTRAAFLAATDDLSEAQWNFKAGPTRWSIAQVAEHIAAAEGFLLDMVSEKVMPAPAREEPADLEALDTQVLQAIADRTNKVQAPEPLAPSNRFGSPAASVQQFKESRGRTLAFLKETKGLRDHAVDSPLGQKLDAYQWLLFISAHSERHTKQIEEVKADANFPEA